MDSPLQDLAPPSEPMPLGRALVVTIQSAATDAPPPQGARAIAELLLRGVPPRAAAAGLDALGVLGRAEGAPAILRFLQHRRASLRRHAIAAARAVATPELIRALVGLLGDPNAEVRVDAAQALADVGDATMVPALRRAFERALAAHSDDGLAAAAAAGVARLGREDDVAEIGGMLRRVSFDVLAPAFTVALTRNGLSERFRIRLITQIGDLATDRARAFLTEVSQQDGVSAAVARAARAASESVRRQ